MAPHRLLVCARKSPLSRAQFEEMEREIHQHHPGLILDPFFIETTGDKDQKTSLRSMEKTNFFTKELDELVLQSKCRIALHSAKDLADPLPDGLCLIAVTFGLDPSDVIVFREGETLFSLPANARIATSSVRREAAARELRKDLRFIDLRGTIEMRLAKLKSHEADGVIVAEAALIRLKLTHLNRVKLPGKTAPMQGQLAITGRFGDIEAKELFSCLDSR